jgi:tetrapyrrole methylase family protein/MazG family protein
LFRRAVKFHFISGAGISNVSRPRPKRHKNSPGRKRPKKSAAKSARRHSAKLATLPADLRAKRVGKLFEDLAAVQARLRAPGGCPWDREQTHLTLRTYLIEEAYEVLEAIEKGNPQDLAEELGDLLLQVLFHADLAREAGQFDISNVVAGIQDKMVRRHPHVFGNVKAETAGQVLKNWAQLKAKEKQGKNPKSEPSKDAVPSALEGVPRNLPALLEAYQLTRRAAQVGFDWEHVEGVLEKLQEEIAELRAAIDASNRRATEEEVGDLLFSAVNLARFLSLDPEVTLKHSNLKFKLRFEDMESEASHSKRRLTDLSKEELEQLWEAAKSRSRAQDSAEAKS